MPLEILGPLVAFGILSAVLFVRFVADTPARLIESRAGAETILKKDFPVVTTAGNAVISSDRKTAIIELLQPIDQIGLVSSLGSKHLTRLLTGADLRSVEALENAGLAIGLNEFTLPKIEMGFSSNKERDTVLELMSGLQIQANTRQNAATEAT